MKFGVFLNQYYTPDSDFEVTDLYEQADLMEDVGFDSATLGERHVHEEGIVEPLTTLAALAGRTDHLELGATTLLPALYHPLHLAEQVAMIDRLSGGRMHFGGAIGYRRRELEPFGIERERRADAFMESLEVLKRLWTEDSVSHEGRWSFEDVFISPKPVGEMPVWIGGHADIAIKRAAYRGDAWVASASSTPDDLEHQVQVYEDALDEFGMDRSENELILMRDCYVADSEAEAKETIEPYLLTLYEMYARWGMTYMEEHEVEVDWDELEEKFLLGAPEEIASDLETYADLGVDHVVLRVQFPGQPQEPTLRCLERFGDEVIPGVQ